MLGTLIYYPPEIPKETKGKMKELNYRKFGKAGDMWAIGVIAYLMLVQTPPFALNQDGNQKQYEAWNSFLTELKAHKSYAISKNDKNSIW